MEFVNQGDDPQVDREVIARAVHERFLEEQSGKKPANDPSMVPWEQLPSNYREDNLRVADDIQRKMGLIGCGLRPCGPGEGASDFEFTPQEIEILAEDEHRRWMAGKQQQGYVLGKVKHDEPPKTHPCMVPWSKLSDVEREKDRLVCRGIPVILAKAGFTVYRFK